MNNLFNRLLSCLCIADILFLVSNLLVIPFHFGLKVLCKVMLQLLPSLCTVQAAHLSFLFPILESTCHFSLSASIFMIMTITIERWQAVCFPFSYQVTCTICTLIFFLAFYFIKQK